MQPHSFVSVDKFNGELKKYETIFGDKKSIECLLATDQTNKFSMLNAVVGDTDTLENTRHEILETLEGFATNVDHYRVKYIIRDIQKIYGPIENQPGYNIDPEQFEKLLQKWKLDYIIESLFASPKHQGFSFSPKFLSAIIVDAKRDDEVRTYLINDYKGKPQNEKNPEDNKLYVAAKELLPKKENN